MPRDPQRMDKVLFIIRKYWWKYPDLRLGQLILNVVPEDRLYQLEEDELIKLLEEKYE